MIKKYKLTEETLKIEDHTLYRIIALQNFTDVKKGDLGGFIEKESNLSHNGNCWIYNEAVVYGNASVRENAKIYGKVVIRDHVIICGRTEVDGDGIVYG